MNFDISSLLRVRNLSPSKDVIYWLGLMSIALDDVTAIITTRADNGYQPRAI